MSSLEPLKNFVVECRAGEVGFVSSRRNSCDDDRVGVSSAVRKPSTDANGQPCVLAHAAAAAAKTMNATGAMAVRLL